MSGKTPQRRETSAQLAADNPVIPKGEIAYETDKNQFAIGDGKTRWSKLVKFHASTPGEEIVTPRLRPQGWKNPVIGDPWLGPSVNLSLANSQFYAEYTPTAPVYDAVSGHIKGDSDYAYVRLSDQPGLPANWRKWESSYVIEMDFDIDLSVYPGNYLQTSLYVESMLSNFDLDNSTWNSLYDANWSDNYGLSRLNTLFAQPPVSVFTLSVHVGPGTTWWQESLSSSTEDAFFLEINFNKGDPAYPVLWEITAIRARPSKYPHYPAQDLVDPIVVKPSAFVDGMPVRVGLDGTIIISDAEEPFLSVKQSGPTVSIGKNAGGMYRPEYQDNNMGANVALGHNAMRFPETEFVDTLPPLYTGAVAIGSNAMALDYFPNVPYMYGTAQFGPIAIGHNAMLGSITDLAIGTDAAKNAGYYAAAYYDYNSPGGPKLIYDDLPGSPGSLGIGRSAQSDMYGYDNIAFGISAQQKAGSRDAVLMLESCIAIGNEAQTNMGWIPNPVDPNKPWTPFNDFSSQIPDQIFTGIEKNIAIGASSQFRAAGNKNVAIGDNSQYETRGNNNVALGSQASYKLTTGSNNVHIGQSSGYGVAANGVTISSHQTFVGTATRQESTSDVDNSYAVAVGYQARSFTRGVAVGAKSAATAIYSTAIGTGSIGADYGAKASASGAVAIGADSTGQAAISSTVDHFQAGTGRHTFSAGNPGNVASAAGKWKFGKVKTAAVTLNANAYIEVEIDGVIHKLLKAS